MTDQRFAAGDIVARKYRVERVLGQGAMGVVVAATHVDLAQPVALKLMLPDKEQTPELRERFVREARAAVRLKSQHVAKVLDVGTDEQGMPYIAMEFLEGNDLAVILQKKGLLSFEEAVEYVLQACEAVGEAHVAGIIHRDLKPANMFLTRDVSGAPCIKVLDFGISKVMGAELTLTQEAQALGSPMYMSPEALGSAKNVDTRTDIWALGIILYQLVAGKTPFHESTMGQLCTRIVMGSPTPLEQYRSDAPMGFEAVIHRCLARDRDQRFENVAAFAHAIAPFAPPRARVYVERIARIMSVDLDKLGPSVHPVGPLDAQASLPLSVRSQAGLATLPGAGATSQTGVVMTAASVSSTLGVPAKPKSQLPVIVGVALAIAIPGAYLLLRNKDTPATNAPSSAIASPSVAVTSPPTPVTASAVATTGAPPSPSAVATASATSVPAPALPPITPTTKPVTTTKATAKPIKNSKVPDYDERQ